ncbi:hypothetical protein JPSP53_14170 [Staphylococcus pseudintermedius]
MMYILKGGLKSDFYSTFLLGKYYRLDVTLKIVQAYLNNNGYIFLTVGERFTDRYFNF